MLVVVVASIGEQPIGLLAWPADLPGHRPSSEVFDQRQKLSDVVAVPAGEADRERDAARVDQQMVL